MVDFSMPQLRSTCYYHNSSQHEYNNTLKLASNMALLSHRISMRSICFVGSARQSRGLGISLFLFDFGKEFWSIPDLFIAELKIFQSKSEKWYN